MPSVIPGATNLMMSTSAEPKEHEIPIPPTPEQVVGYVNPYRGMEEHGVEHTAEFEDTPIDENTLHTFDKPESEPEPIPVKIVSSGGREFRTWNVRREYANPAGSGASRILGQDETRTKAKLKNIGTAIIFISPDPINNSALGYPIGTNVEFEYNQEGDVWAVTDDPAAQPIAIVVEYAVRE
jgi:hypothetical protein